MACKKSKNVNLAFFFVGLLVLFVLAGYWTQFIAATGAEREGGAQLATEEADALRLELKNCLIQRDGRPEAATAPAEAPKGELPPPQPTAPTAPTEDAPKRIWLMILVPTISRETQEYLSKTLGYLETEMTSFGGSVGVAVWNSRRRAEEVNDAFVAARSSRASDGRFIFAENPDQPREFTDMELRKGDANVPGPVVQKQSRDVAAMLKFASGKADFYLLMEDDWRLCPNALVYLEYAIRKALRRDPDFITLVVSHGLNGIVLRNRDLDYFAGYLERHQARRPPDHLVIEWQAGEKPESKEYKGGRKHMTFRYTLLEHFGQESSMGHPDGDTPRCFKVLDYLFEVQSFKPKLCETDDVWPCENDAGFLKL